MDHALRHCERALPDIERQQQFTLGVHRHPDPLGRALKALQGRSLADLTMRGGGTEGAQDWGALVSSHALQCGFVMRPAKGFGSRRRWRRDGIGGEGVE
jgi:hypothetical protein